MTTILFATDFSPGAGQALGIASRMARTSRARLHLFHAVVLETPYVVPADAIGYVPMQEELLQQLEENARSRMDELSKQLEDLAPRVTTQVRRADSAVDALLDSAQECGADLIVMSSHGRRGFRRFLLGSVTEEVVRRAACPTLVVRRDPEQDLDLLHGSRIMAALDLSPASDSVLEGAKTMATSLEKEIDLVHVVEAPAYPIGAMEAARAGTAASLAAYDVRTREALESSARKQLELSYQSAGCAEIPARNFVYHGATAERIVHHAEESDISAIVVGAQGHTGLSKMLLGSACEKVLRTAPCPVLVVPRPDSDGG